MKWKPWTTTELRRASALWKEGRKIDEIAAALGRGRESIKHQIVSRRDLFPRRHAPRSEVRNDGDPIKLRFTISPFMHRTIKAEAKKRGISQCMLIREALRDQILRRASPEQAAGSCGRVR